MECRIVAVEWKNEEEFCRELKNKYVYKQGKDILAH
uniref:Uncharacterized protein n=1 Tax=Myoviridae sp. ctOv05 TaxID=2825094 RepID=A0A8S5P6D0_9CAUD|nr:MAG TPA: hypothetical protein [Myoviridae sp. ctOv05]